MVYILRSRTRMLAKWVMSPANLKIFIFLFYFIWIGSVMGRFQWTRRLLQPLFSFDYVAQSYRCCCCKRLEEPKNMLDLLLLHSWKGEGACGGGTTMVWQCSDGVGRWWLNYEEESGEMMVDWWLKGMSGIQ